MADDLLSLKARVRAILNKCNIDQVSRIYEFCKQVRTGNAASVQAASADAATAQQQAPATTATATGTDAVVTGAKIPDAATPLQPSQPQRMIGNLQVDYLCGRWMHFVGTVAQWIFDAYFRGRGSESYEEILQMTKVCYAAMMPIRLIAADGPECIGSLSLVKYEQNDRNLTPMLNYLVVHPSYTNCGVEQILIKHSAKVLRGLGHRVMYITLDKRAFCPADMDWQPVENMPGIYKHNIV